MSEPQPFQPSDLETSIHALARNVREARHLEPQAQQALADLVDELSKTLHSAPLATEEIAHLADSAAQLAQALQQPHETEPLTQARERLEEATGRIRVAPLLKGVAGRLLDVLADLGI